MICVPASSNLIDTSTTGLRLDARGSSCTMAQTALTDPQVRTSPVTIQQQLWAETVAEKKRLAESAEAHKILAVDNFDDALAFIKDLRSKYTSSKTVRWLERLRPAFERLRAFTQAISMFVKSDTTYSALVSSTYWPDSPIPMRPPADRHRFGGVYSW